MILVSIDELRIKFSEYVGSNKDITIRKLGLKWNICGHTLGLFIRNKSHKLRCTTACRLAAKLGEEINQNLVVDFTKE